ncbi:sensor histidine kinase [Dactylosporangium sp. NPDC000244]|uniref:sensor histidine kinase n=1 Tax=Dactylosporangium sp. NPDC000244 TaxID=3154365 RepID=UPI0033192B7E
MELPPVLTRRLTPKGLYALDAVAAIVVAVICWAAALEVPKQGLREPTWVSALVAVVFGLSVALRRRWTYAMAFTATAAAVISLATQIIPVFASFGPACALSLVFYTFGAYARNWKGMFVIITCGALVSASMVGSILLSDEPPSGDSPSTFFAALFGFLVIAPAQTLGFAIGERRAQTIERNQHMVRQATVEERLRVARELHDVIAHTMTLIVVKASIGNHVAEANPAEARDALQVIESTGRAAMLEVRRVLDILREDTPYAPTRGLGDLPALVELASVGGVQVRLDVERPEGPAVGEMPEAVELAVYRIVQEAITNVVKHAAPAQCHVSVVVNAEEVRIEVNDDGKRPPRPDAVGHGLTGMRERVTLHGGTFAAGPRAEGGYSVRALLPAGGAA